jgi:hypothetical protein
MWSLRVLSPMWIGNEAVIADACEITLVSRHIPGLRWCTRGPGAGVGASAGGGSAAGVAAAAVASRASRLRASFSSCFFFFASSRWRFSNA